MKAPAAFDYESAIWGEEVLIPGEHSIAGFRLAQVLSRLPERGRVLEVGCGAGRFLRAVERARPELVLVGADVSRAALRRAAELSPEIELRLVPNPDAPLPAADGEFDAVLALDVIEHVAAPDLLLAEIARVVRPGGLLLAHVPCEGDPLSLWRWIPGQGGPGGLKRRLAGHIQRFRRSDLLARIRAAGFEIVSLRHSLHLAGNLSDVLAFAWLAARGASAHDGEALTTSTLVARAAELRQGGRGTIGGRFVQLADAALWWEATLLGRIPSWAVHVCARRLPSGSPADDASRARRV